MHARRNEKQARQNSDYVMVAGMCAVRLAGSCAVHTVPVNARCGMPRVTARASSRSYPRATKDRLYRPVTTVSRSTAESGTPDKLRQVGNLARPLSPQAYHLLPQAPQAPQEQSCRRGLRLRTPGASALDRM
jgi:hypothetical protein